MKPRSKPGKIATEGRSAREVFHGAKLLTRSQIEHMQTKKKPRKSKKAGKGGKRAGWDIDFEEGVRYAMKKMPERDNPALTVDGIRKYPKNGH